MDKNMTTTEALKIVGNRASWELLNMKLALSTLTLLNTPEENKRLEAIKILLKKDR